MNQVSENPVKNRIKSDSLFSSSNALFIITGLLITLYLTANIMAVKLISVFGVTLFDAGTVTFPFAYMLGDVLAEVWGFRTARKVILLSFFCNIILVLSTSIGVILPYPDYTAETADAYARIFTYVPRIVCASLIAFVLGELSNAWMLVKIREWTKGKFLWVRTIGSSVVGYVFDTVLFVILAFAGTAPAKDLATMIIAQYLMKLFIEAVTATPFAYLIIYKLKKHIPQQDANAEY